MMWYLSKIRGLDDLRDRDDLVLGAEVNTLLKSRNIKIYIKYNIMAANPEEGGSRGSWITSSANKFSS